MNCAKRFWKWWWTLLGNSTSISHRFSLIFANSVFSTGFFSKFYYIQWSEFNGWYEWRRSAQQPTLAYCSPLQTQIINSSSRVYIRRGLRTSLGLLLLCCRCQNFKPFGTPHSIHHSATFILSAVPGSFDLSFDASYRAGLIIFHQNLLQNQTPFFTASTEKAKRQKMW